MLSKQRAAIKSAVFARVLGGERPWPRHQLDFGVAEMLKEEEEEVEVGSC